MDLAPKVLIVFILFSLWITSDFGFFVLLLPILLLLFNIFGHYLQVFLLKGNDFKGLYLPKQSPGLPEVPITYVASCHKIDCCFYVPQKVDAAFVKLLDGLFESLLDNLEPVSGGSKDFEKELKHVTRLCLLKLLYRLKTVDIKNFVIQGVLPCLMDHFHFCLSKMSKSHGDLANQSFLLVSLFEAGKLHPSLVSRRSELHYLRSVFNKLIDSVPPQIVHSRVTMCLLQEAFASKVLQLSDQMADSDTMNLMVSRILNGSKIELKSPTSLYVPFLHSYFNKSSPANRSVVLIDSILKDQEMLAVFMQFMHRENAVHYIQCYKDCSEVLDSHNFDQKDVFDQINARFVDKNEETSIRFDNDVLVEWDKVIRSFTITAPTSKKSALENIIKETSYILEMVFLPRFKSTFEFFDIWWGQGKNLPFRRKKRNVSSKSMIEFPTDLNNNSPVVSSDEDGDSLSIENSHESLFNLSSFRIYFDSNVQLDNTNSFVYRINLNNASFNPVHDGTHVLRKFEHFRGLHSKLKRFYLSKLRNIDVPSSMMLSIKKSKESYERYIPVLQGYIETLLRIPELRFSKLLFQFLTVKDGSIFEESYIENVFASARAFKDAPKKLVAEKGQALDTFLLNIEKCTKTGPRQSMTPRKGSLGENGFHELHINPLYQNNAYLDILKADSSHNVHYKSSTYPQFPSFFDFIVYFFTYIYQLSSLLQKVLYGPIKVFFASSINNFWSLAVEKQLAQTFHEDQIEYFLDFLYSSMFSPAAAHRSSKDKEDRKKRTLEAMYSCAPFVAVLTGKGQHSKQTNRLFQILQYSKLNKHIFYMILDRIIEAIYSE